MILIDANTVQVTAAYDEPTTSQDGTPLTDLAYTEVEYQLNGGTTEVLEPKVLATKPQGGGHISNLLTLPAPAGAVSTFVFRVFAVDLVGNRLADAALATLTFIVDRIAPAAPTNFTIA